jgi:flagellar hook-associated protein 1 FlgK
MLGLFGILNLGARSLEVQQTGVAVTGQNLANVNNPAYARQRVDIQTSLPTWTFVGPQGTGSQVAAIQQLRDSLLDGQIVNESSVGGYWNAQQSALQNAQTELGQFLNTSGAAGTNGAGSAPGLSDQLTNLFNAFQSVATDPTSLAQRQGLVNQAQALTSSLNQASQNLSSVNTMLNTSLSNSVTSANQLLSDIANLNNQIINAEALNKGKANDLRDLRQQDIENLAKLVNVDTTATANGGVDVSINGTQLVSGKQLLDTLQTYDPGNGELQVETATSGTPLTLTGGSMQGTIAARDGALQTLRNGLDTLASTLVTQVNNIYQTGYDLNGNTGAAFFTGTNAATIGVNAALLTDPSAVQAAGVAGAPGDNTVALALGQLGSQSIGALGNQTFIDNYAGQVQNFGNALSNANDQVNNYNAVNTMMLQQRDSVSGISIEEEMSNLITYQYAYQASSKIITTADQMLQTVVNLKST